MSFTPEPNEFQPPAYEPEAGDHAAEATPLNLPAVSGPVTGSGAGEFLGYTIRETSGTTAATVVLYDNATAASGEVLAEISIAGGGTSTDEINRPGRKVQNGIYAQITGAVAGSVFQ